MNVQVMRYIVDALQTSDTVAESETAVRLWGGELVDYVRSSANHIFRFTRRDKTYYLRLAHELERHPTYIQAELDFILHCANKGLAVARPVLSINDSYVEAVESGNGRYYAVVFEELKGDQYEAEELNETMYRAWGAALARLHQASQSFPARPVRLTWQEQIQDLLGTLPPGEHALAHILELGLVWLDQRPIQDFGLIHGDFELDNLVWDGEQWQVLDFDAATYTWYAVDIAIALEDVLSSSDGVRDERVHTFLEGYREVYPLPAAIMEDLPRFSSLLLAVKMARVLHAYATHKQTDPPDWLVTMQNRHQNWLTTKRALLKWE